MIKWLDIVEIIARVKNGEDNKQFERMCISMISHPDSSDDTFVFLEQWAREVPQIPVSILVQPHDARLRRLGTVARPGEIFTVVLDAVTPEIFDRTRGCGVDSPHKRDKCWRTLEWPRKSTGRKNSACPHVSRMRFDASGRLTDFGIDRDAGGTGRFRETVSDFRLPRT